MECLVHKHTSIHDCLAVRWWLGQLVIDDGHVVWHLVVRFLKIHLAGKLLTHLIQGLCGPVSKPIEHTSKKDISCQLRIYIYTIHTQCSVIPVEEGRRGRSPVL